MSFAPYSRLLQPLLKKIVHYIHISVTQAALTTSIRLYLPYRNFPTGASLVLFTKIMSHSRILRHNAAIVLPRECESQPRSVDFESATLSA